MWLDGNYPQQIRSKTKIIDKELNFKKCKENPSILPMWNFDGSSTNQAATDKSELLLKPVNIFKDPFKDNGYIVVSEVYHTDGTPHKTNKRTDLYNITNCHEDEEVLVGLEQEYFIYDRKTDKPLGWPENGFPRPQGDYYCAVGGNNVIGRDFVEEHASLCEVAGLEISGINAEVTLGQWEYQIGPVYAIEGSDQLWVSRYILNRLSEKYNYYIVLDPKPYKGNEWNGSGMHANFSTKSMREDMKNKKRLVIEACEKLGQKVQEHIEVYGPNNEYRLTGANETCSINEFRYGIGDRTASIRIPSSIDDKTTTGYLEDRRPASNGDPYQIINVLVKTICGDKKNEKSEKKQKSEKTY
jgi:glutamine synthetase